MATTSTTDIGSILAQAGQSIISGATNSTLDVNSLVTSLVQAKTIGQQTTLTNKQTADNTELSAVGKLKSALSALQTAITGLSNGTTLSGLAATASGNGITASVKSGGGAVAGSYAVNVTQLATANKLSSAGITSTDTISAGSLSITLGTGTAFNVNVAAGASLSDIAKSINTTAGNPGVTASVITGSDGQHLVIQSNNTGAANTVSVSGTGVNSKLTSGYTTVTAAADAKLTVDGTPVTSASNSVSGVLTGVTLNLTTQALNTTQTVTLSPDTTATTTAINAFVSAYNTYVTTAQSLSSYDPNTSTAGPLLGDSMLNTISNGLATAISGGVTTGGSTYSLAAIGISLQADGTLQVDSSALNTALTSNNPAVGALFNTTNGVGQTLNNLVSNYTQTNGLIDQRTTAINADLKSLSDQATQLQNYSAQLTTQYNAQFTALNNLMATMANNTKYLTQLFGGTNSAGALATNK
ncbi:flagellar filament capping protein FliD [Burkholderia seminalis]|uniref:flagellar filament capping protein FliD n=1 Tax=Burkholderia TaxID=32008 RepID=UPI000F591C31|nr:MULTISPECIES: flagellar filament capping protein FliD [Burkholderia]MBJ9591188.1 flagellar filament capping protein FliD [Burkholderia seminalis]MBJ9966234.1 flagellar filament capping protein FliD [Burkholderia seminalis]MBN3741388.1 flagellar filament capping protein FliD [Burkholderia sp. Tr-20355]MCA7953294.1 flagellar filament capping protein FliD [Burkholderia seminalis]MCA8427265.1 flagellar filament capping protein FliD [Burkholderia seminalis]